MSFSGNTLSSNRAISGGGIGASYGTTFNVNGNTLNGNVATTNGGGLSFFFSRTVTLTNNVLYSNTATQDGGALYSLEQTTITLTNNTVMSNTATNAFGGGVEILLRADTAVANLYGNILLSTLEGRAPARTSWWIPTETGTGFMPASTFQQRSSDELVRLSHEPTGLRGPREQFEQRVARLRKLRFGRLPASADLADLPKPFANHNGGTLLFGPDGMLYLGDGGGAGDPNNNAQTGRTLFGKMLRVDVSGGAGSGYSIPPDNPFVGSGDPQNQVLDEIWAKGLRNPYRFTFDRATNDIYIGDVGQATIEEIDVQPASSRGGENYGWRITEGSTCYNPNPCDKTGLTLPVHEYTHGGSPFRCSVTGGNVYRGAIPEIRGHYFFADYCSAQIWSFVWSAASGVSSFQERTAALQPDIGSIASISSFGEDGLGELYVVDRGNGSGGEVFKIVTLLDNDQADNDFNGDGRSDILWRHQTRGENSIWTMNWTSFLAKTVIPTVADLNQEMAGSADFNGDGKYDIL